MSAAIVPKRARAARPILYGLAALVLVAFTYNLPGLVAAHKQQKALETTFRRYSDSLLTQDYPAAYSVGDMAFKTAISLQDFTAQEKSFESELGKMKSDKIAASICTSRGIPCSGPA